MFYIISKHNKFAMNYHHPSHLNLNGGRGPNIPRQLLVIIGTWALAKIYIRESRGGGGCLGGNVQPKLITH